MGSVPVTPGFTSAEPSKLAALVLERLTCIYLAVASFAAIAEPAAETLPEMKDIKFASVIFFPDEALTSPIGTRSPSASPPESSAAESCYILLIAAGGGGGAGTPGV